MQGTLSTESLSEEGRTTITLEVDPEIEMGTYVAEVNDQLSRLHPHLPDRVRPFLTRQVPEALRNEQGFMTLQLVGPLPQRPCASLLKKRLPPGWKV